MKRGAIWVVTAMLAVLGSWVGLAPRTATADVLLVRTWDIPAVMDQGTTPACVGYGYAAWAMSAPSLNRAPIDPYALYRFAQTLDEWPGEDYAGTSAGAGAQALAAWGRLHSYSYTAEYEVMRAWMLHRGPVLLSTPWLQGMMGTRANGYVTARGDLVGFHLVECYDIRGGSVGCLNSWGDKWGKGGTFRISRPDFERLFLMGAEVVLPTYPPPTADAFTALQRFS